MKLRNVILLTLLPTTFCQAESTFHTIGKLLNRAQGAFYHQSLLRLGHSTNHPVHPELEQLARTVIKEIHCTQPINIYQSTSNPAFCLGNNLYLRDSDLPFYKAHLNSLRFVIAHELMHIEKFHTIKRWAADFALWAYPLIFIKVLYANKWQENSRPMSKNFGYFSWSLGAGTWLYLALRVVKPWVRAQETEADASAMSALGPLYGHDSIAKGAAVFLAACSSHEPYGWYDTLFAEHPHSRDRIEALGVSPKKLAQEFPHFITSWLIHFIELTNLRCNKKSSNCDKLEKQMLLEAQSADDSVLIASIDPEAAQIIAQFLDAWEFKAIIDENKQRFLNTSNSNLNRTEFLEKIHDLTNNIQNNLIPYCLGIIRRHQSNKK